MKSFAVNVSLFLNFFSATGKKCGRETCVVEVCRALAFENQSTPSPAAFYATTVCGHSRTFHPHLTEKLYNRLPDMQSQNDKDISNDLQTVSK